jgi:hypothetical protein
MVTPLLTLAANGHNFLTFEAYETFEWLSAVQWLKKNQFSEAGQPVFGADEAILPSFVRGSISIAAGFDNWSGNYLLAQCDEGDQIILEVAARVSAEDRRARV